MHSSMIQKVSARMIAAVLAVASVAPVAQAQYQSFAAQVKVPFAFESSSGQHFQPGVYTISVTGMQTMLIRSATNSGLAKIQEQANEGLPASRGKAVFAHYGDKYYLRSVTVPGSSTRMLFGESKEERQMQIAARKTPSAVELAVLQAGR
jgi:hypothetical protein